MFVFLFAVASAMPGGAPLGACATFTPSHPGSTGGSCEESPFGLYITAMDDSNADDNGDDVFDYVANATYRSN